MRFLVAALTAIAVVAGLATVWPWELLVLAGLVAGLGIIAHVGRMRLIEGLAMAGFVAGVLFIFATGLVTSVFYGPDWLPAGVGLGVRLAVLALGLATLALPSRART